MTINGPAAAELLVGGLQDLVDIHYASLPDAVARLDLSEGGWNLYLDSDSPPEDHNWAMLNVFRILILGLDAAGPGSVRVPRLRIVLD